MFECTAIEARGSRHAWILINHLEEEREKALKAEIRLMLSGHEALSKVAADRAEKYRRRIDRIKKSMYGM